VLLRRSEKVKIVKNRRVLGNDSGRGRQVVRIAAFVLTVVGMAAAIGRHGHSPLHSVAALGMGTIMLALLLDPELTCPTVWSPYGTSNSAQSPTLENLSTIQAGTPQGDFQPKGVSAFETATGEKVTVNFAGVDIPKVYETSVAGKKKHTSCL
jgi:hypothetical protein